MTQSNRSLQRAGTWLFYAIVALLLFLWLQPLAAQKSGNTIIQRTIGGVMLGSIYAIMALGIVVINKASGVFNFAHGAMMMIAGYMFFSFFNTQAISLVAAGLLAFSTVVLGFTMGGWRELFIPQRLITALIIGIILTLMMTSGGTEQRWLHALTGAVTGAVLIGLLVERLTIRPLIGQPIFAAVMVTLALNEVIRGITTLIWGSQPKSLLIFAEPHPFLPDQFVRIQTPITIEPTGLLGFLEGPVNIDQPRFMAFLLALATFALFWFFFRFTNIGLAMRATSENQQLAQSVGLRVRVILAITWAIATVMAGVAGLFYAGSSAASSIDTNFHFVILRAFPAVLLGGLESIGGALVGGLIIGLSEEWAKLLFTGDVAENLAPYIVLMIVLILRPEGLFGEKRIERI